MASSQPSATPSQATLGCHPTPPATAFAAGRPLLAATNGLAQVTAAEETGSADRAKAVALIAAGYGAGAGVIAIVHSLAAGVLGFRGVFVLALVPLALLPLLWRWLEETDRFTVAAAGPEHSVPVIAPVARPFRRRLAVIVVLSFAVSVITGPANIFVFTFAENFLHQPGYVTAGLVTGAVLAIWTYTGSALALVAGYVLGVFAGGVYAPAAGSPINELFPTSVRASVAGWTLAVGVIGAVTGLVVFGTFAGAGGGPGGRFLVAGLVTFLPPALVVVLFFRLPETRGREPEELWPGGWMRRRGHDAGCGQRPRAPPGDRQGQPDDCQAREDARMTRAVLELDRPDGHRDRKGAKDHGNRDVENAQPWGGQGTRTALLPAGNPGGGHRRLRSFFAHYLCSCSGHQLAT
jgi:MFS family permease